MRYRSYGSYDDQPILDGDEGFMNMNTMTDPSQLENGVVTESRNMRLTKGVAESRKGTKLYLPPASANLVAQEGILDAIAVGLDGVDDDVLIATNNKAFKCNEQGHSLIAYPLNFPQVQSAFLLDTRVNTLMFSDPGPTLPFALDVTLGNSVLRLADGESEFKHWKQVNATQITYSATGTHSVTLSQNTDLKIGEKIKIVNGAGFSNFAWEVSNVGDKSIEITSTDNSVKSNLADRVANMYLYSLADQCPPAYFATWAGNRLIVPVGVDELAISSPLSTHDFPVTNKLVIGSGESGDIQALEPLADDGLICFKNHSIHIITGVYEMKGASDGGRLAITRVTDQLGCTARDSIQVIGDEVIFLSPQGIYGLTLNAKGAGGVGLPPQAVRVSDVPLSRNINDHIESFDQDKSSACFHRGKYYIFNGSEIFVYSTLTQGWESIDSVPVGALKLISINNQKARLLIIHNTSSILEGEANEIGQDASLGQAEDFESFITTREYRSNSYDNKHYRRVQLSWDAVDAENNFEVTANTNNPDTTNKVIDYQGNNLVAQGNYSTRANLRSRGESISLKISNNNLGRIKVKRVLVEASGGSRGNNKL